MIIRLSIILAWSPLLLAASHSSSSNGDRHRVHSVFAAQQENRTIEQRANKEQRLAKELTLTDYLQRSQQHISRTSNSFGKQQEDYLAALGDLMIASQLIDKAPLEELERANSAIARSAFSSLHFPTYPQYQYAWAVKARLRISKLTQQQLHETISTLPPESTHRLCIFARPLTYLSYPEVRRLTSVSKTLASIAKRLVPPAEAWAVYAYNIMKNNAAPSNFVSSLMLYASPIAALTSIANSYWREPHYVRIYEKQNNRVIPSEWYRMLQWRKTETAGQTMVHGKDNAASENQGTDERLSNYAMRPDDLLTPQGILYGYGIASYLLHRLTGNPELLPNLLSEPLKKELASALERHLPALYRRLRRQHFMAEADGIVYAQGRKTRLQQMPSDTEALFALLTRYNALLRSTTNPLAHDACILNMIELLDRAIGTDLIKNLDDWNKLKGVQVNLEKNCATSHTRLWLSACSERATRIGNSMVVDALNSIRKEKKNAPKIDAYIPAWDITINQIGDPIALQDPIPEFEREANALPQLPLFDFDSLEG